MDSFPRTEVGGLSLSRLVIGSNWFLGFSHWTSARSNFIKQHQTRERIADILVVFLENGIDTIIAPCNPLMAESLDEAEQRAGRSTYRIWTPNWKILPDADDMEPEAAIDLVKSLGGHICMPHQCTTDALLDKMHKTIRNLDVYTKLIRERGLVPGLSTHAPESVVYADSTNADVATYVQIYNAAGFLMQIEIDWALRVITGARHPVLTIKPLAAGRLDPIVGLSFVWSTVRECDMVAVGTTTPDEAREIIEISRAALERRSAALELQKTRSKKTLEA
ncbi:MAG: hypothetical protein JW909_08775 [Planctomycetes bacterium]|nr:hypothetical protein [Planctomycetota bacterium]